jgi:hypothetical protein
MRRWALVAGLVVTPLSADDSAPAGIRVGMPAAEVQHQLGAAKRIVRQVLYRRHIEQWVYENPQEFRVQISWNPGEVPIVTGVIRSGSTNSGRKS